MARRPFPCSGFYLLLVLASMPILHGYSIGQHEQAFAFNSINGAGPQSTLIADAAGNLYGTASEGGSLLQCGNGSGCGVVFQFIPPSQPGGQWAENTLYSFLGGADGAVPNGSLVFDKAGNLYGTTQNGGACNPEGCGTIFELSPPPQPGGSWTETVLYSFGGLSGDTPMAGLIIDSGGNLFGTTSSAGPFAGGTIFELSPASQPGGQWAETTLYNFGAFQGDAAGPVAPLVFDSAGNLYGTTAGGGSNPQFCTNPPEFGCGTVFELSPPTQPGGPWTEAILYNFGSVPKDGMAPFEGLTITPSGALLGTTPTGGLNYGVVFALAAPSSPGGTWQYGIPYRFTGGADGATPYSALAIVTGRSPVLYGTTKRGGAGGEGTVFQLTPPSPGGSWVETPVYNFSGANDGGRPLSGVTVYNFALYGTTAVGGSHGYGTVFRLSR